MPKPAGPSDPEIRKLGTLDLDMVEATPVVFRDRLYRFEYVRKDYKPNTTGDSYFRFIDVETGKATPAFAHGYDLGCAYAEGGSMWAFGVDHWDGTKIVAFRSNDLEHWETITGPGAARLGAVQHVGLQGGRPLRHGDRGRQAARGRRRPVHHPVRRVEGPEDLEAAARGRASSPRSGTRPARRSASSTAGST